MSSLVRENINQKWNLHFTKMVKEEKSKPKARERKTIVKIRMQFNKIKVEKNKITNKSTIGSLKRSTT